MVVLVPFIAQTAWSGTDCPSDPASSHRCETGCDTTQMVAGSFGFVLILRLSRPWPHEKNGDLT